MKNLSWQSTRFRRVTATVAALALASVAVACGDSSTGPGAVTGVDIVVLPIGTATTDLNRGSTLQLLAAPRDANDQFVNVPVTWSSSDAAKATVDASGLVTIGTGAAAGGNVTITATTAAGVAGTFPLNVQHAVATVTIAPATATIRQEGTVDLDATLVDAGGATVTRPVVWSSSNTAIATVNASTGVVTGVADGTATITATVDNAEIAAASNTATITVAGAPLVASVTVTPALPWRGVGGTVQMTHTSRAASGTTISGTTATWASSNTSVATVTSTGLVTILAEGASNISATVDNGIGTNVQGTTEVRGADLLVNGVAGTANAASGTSDFLTIAVPAGQATLTVTTSGGTGDADLYVFAPTATVGAANPDPGAFAYGGTACRSALGGNAETCTVNNPVAGNYKIAIYAWRDSPSFTTDANGVSVTATHAP